MITNRVLFTGVIALAASVANVSAAGQQKSPYATDENPTTIQQAGKCEVMCVDPHSCCEESAKVIQTLRKLVVAYTQGDIKTYEDYLDDECSMFEEGTRKLISGKQAILDHLRQSFLDNAPNGKHPLISYTIDQPFAKVTNDTCVVTFFATKMIGGAQPRKEQAHITDVFVKHGDKWKKVHWSGNWEIVEG